MLSARGRLVSVGIVCWCKGPNYCSLFPLRPLDTARPTLCLVAFLIVNALLRWVSYAVTSIVRPGAASAPSLSPAVLSYVVKALAFKALRY